MANFNTEVNINPDKGLKSDQQPRILKAVYGDGYEQRVAAGINNIPESWNLTWKNRTSAEANKIVRFLEEQGGVTAFDWYPTGYEISSTTDATPITKKLVDANQYFTARYLNTTVTDSGGTTTTVTAVDSATTLSLAADIMSGSETYTIYPYKKYTCAKWSSQETLSGIRTITATFTKVFEP